MEKSQNLIKKFETVLFLSFDKIKKLPNYGQVNSAFIVLSPKSDAEPILKELIKNLQDSDVILEHNKGIKNSHSIFFGDNTKATIIYAQTEEELNWLYEYNSYSSYVIFGKLFKKALFKYNELGLRYIQYGFSKTHKYEIGEYLVTKDFKTILEIFELDYEEFKQGFNTIEDFFKFILKTPYIKIEKFVDLEKESRNETLQKFQEYLILNNIQNTNYKSFKKESIVSMFPELLPEIEKLEALATKKLETVDKFNGKVLMDTIPGVNPTDIGRIMREFYTSFNSKEAFKEFIAERSREEIFDKLKEVVTL